MCSYTQTLGQVGLVTKQTVTMYVQVSVNGKRWIYSPKCLIPASEDELPEQYGTVHTQCTVIVEFCFEHHEQRVCINGMGNTFRFDTLTNLCSLYTLVSLYPSKYEA